MTQSNPLEEVCHSLLQSVGEDPNREGLLRTPARYARAFQELTSGYSQSIEEVVG
ncbi:MAG: GTP cyclohydrolase I, partial [Bdellovibrionales bacterium]|nr:GTP cyclohydrolase I [Bdellovibrionales bacterium]